ncbi:MAG: hypothetical protein ACR2MQ_10130, partial [Gemmatimonadaceae bacterium]
LVRWLAHNGSTFSGVGASSKPGAVQAEHMNPSDPIKISAQTSCKREPSTYDSTPNTSEA